MSILVGVQHILDGRLHLELLLQGEQMLLPGTAALGELHHLPTGINLETGEANHSLSHQLFFFYTTTFNHQTFCTYLVPLVNGFFHHLASWQPGGLVEIQTVQKLIPN